MKNLSKFKVFLSVICICFLAIPQVATAANVTYRVVLTDPGYNLNVREKPNTSSKVVGKLPPGEVVSISKTSGDWGYIYDGRICDGWINLKYTAVGVKRVSGSRKTTDNLNLREGPGTNYSRMYTIPKGSTVEIWYTYKDWTYVFNSSGNLEWICGWVNSSYLKK